MSFNEHGAHSWRRPLSGGLHSYVVNELGGEIAQGKLAPNEIINVNGLCERFGVSRSVVRESLRALESLGLVKARPQVGTRVMALENWDLLNAQVVSWRGYGDEYRTQMTELLEIRRGVEGSAARLAATRMTDEEIEQLKSIAARMAAAGESRDGREFVEADVAFHKLLLEGSHNAVMGQFADTVTAVLYTRQNTDRHTITDLTPQSVRQHTDLALALIAHDPELAEECAIRIVESTLTEFENLDE